MARIPDSFIQDLLARTDLVEVIDARVPLKKTGRNYAACCPFHAEKTPSFTVAPDKQFYYCFGCGAKGNAIGFLMEYESLAFPEAVKQLADRAGMEVPREEESPAQRQQRDRQQTLYDLLARADLYYRQQLRSAAERQPAVTYLKQRGLSGQIAARFGLGLAPPGFENLIQHLSLDEAGLATALEAGLLVRNEDSGRVYDKFRDRIMFPIRDSRGRTIAFGGRVLGDGRPKYLNSPETPVFHKGRELYGLWEWRQSRDDSGRLFVVEGYLDVIALAQHGLPNAVATLGTATTREHAEKLFRQVDEVVFCFDGDGAGRRAAWRALENTLPVLEDSKQVRFLFLPDGEDPDTLVRREGRESLLARADQAPTLSQYLFEHLAADLDLSSLDGRARLARLALPYLQQVTATFYRSLLRKELASLTRLTEEELATLDTPPPPRTEPGDASRDAGSLPPPDSAAAPYAPPWPDGEPGWDSATPVAWGDEDESPRRNRGRRRPRREERPLPRAALQLTMAEQLTLALIQSPRLLEERPLPEGAEQLDLPGMPLLRTVVGLLQDDPHTTPAALLGALMAHEDSERVSRLLAVSLQPPMEETMARRYWHDSLLRLQIRLLEQALEQTKQARPLDLQRLQALTRAMSEARLQLSAPLA